MDLLEELFRTDKRRRGHARKMLALLREFVPQHGLPKAKERCRCLGDGIWELRSVAGEFRLLCFHDGRKVIVCTHAFIKSEQSTDPAEILRAKRIRRAYDEEKQVGRLLISS